MCIAYLAQSYPPMVSGASIAVQGLSTEMAERGHQVLTLTASDRPSPFSSFNTHPQQFSLTQSILIIFSNTSPL